VRLQPHPLSSKQHRLIIASQDAECLSSPVNVEVISLNATLPSDLRPQMTTTPRSWTILSQLSQGTLTQIAEERTLAAYERRLMQLMGRKLLSDVPKRR
jgi:hypothetical protein